MAKKRAKRKRKTQSDKGSRKRKNEVVNTPAVVDAALQEPNPKTQKLSKSSHELLDKQVPNSHPLTTGNKERSPSSDPEYGKQVRFCEFFSRTRPSPLPEFSWADSKEVWEIMLQKDEHHLRYPDMFDQHPALQPRMRAILFDWLMEICKHHELNRETYYLSVDLIDRYLGQSQNIRVDQLELIGITALFTAAKLEGPDPPRSAALAFHTDGDITEEDIYKQERVMIQKLNWDMCPITSIGWLKLYLEVAQVRLRDPSLPALQNDFMFPQYSSFAFAQIARLMDLSILDAGSLKYKHGMLAATAVYHLVSKEVALSASGFKLEDMLPCVTWMAPFATTIFEMGPAEMEVFPSIAQGECHEIQTFGVNSSILERTQGQQAM